MSWKKHNCQSSKSLAKGVPDNDSVRVLSQFVEEMDISDLFRTYFRVRKNTATPRQMLKIMIYAYMNKLYSSRGIETACHRDIYRIKAEEGMTFVHGIG